MTSAPQRYRPEQWGLIVIAAGLLLLVLVGALWVAGIHQRAAARLTEIEPRYARLAGMLQNKEQLAQAGQAAQANLLQYVHPADADAGQVGNGMLQRVRERAAAQGLRVTSSQVIAAREEKDNPGFERIGASLRLEGDWAALQALLRTLPTERPAIFSSIVQLQSQMGLQGRPPSIQVQLDLFALKERNP